MSQQAALDFNHIGLSVPDAQAAVDWYSSVFGLEVIVPVSLIDGPRSESMVACQLPHRK